MLTDEQVREIQIRIEDRGKRWGVEPGEFLNFVESLLSDRAELVAECGRLEAAYMDMGARAAGFEYTVRHLEEENARLRVGLEKATDFIVCTVPLSMSDGWRNDRLKVLDLMDELDVYGRKPAALEAENERLEA